MTITGPAELVERASDIAQRMIERRASAWS